MITVEVCLGSACYVRGSKKAVDILKGIISENHWEDKIELKGSFCQKYCEKQNGLGLRVNNEYLEGVGIHNLKEVFEARINELLCQ